MSSKIYVCYYTPANGAYSADQFIEESYDFTDFVAMCNYPAAEMPANDVVALAKEIYRLTMSAPWVETFNRGLQFGDIVIKDSEIILYIPCMDIPIYRSVHWKCYPLSGEEQGSGEFESSNKPGIVLLPYDEGLVKHLCR